MTAELVKTWKVSTVEGGQVVLTLNGREFLLGTSAHAITFDLMGVCSGRVACENTIAIKHVLFYDQAGGGYDRHTCQTCETQVVRQPYMRDDEWAAMLTAFRADHGGGT